ncbi:hypothetical protein P9W99_18260 [Bacillus cereus]|uniref:Lipoprotein n=1 Tax=Bacillus cereus ISP2954 TaxID=1053215 RepID=A0A9W5VEP4_BACCE|nr:MULTISPECIES: hypothetical protein [Bacillus cereus group]AHZ51065.1 hypothetical protein YBT1520_11775 [Bacillus thuringiensis serovar kurstaki str. YBT-1520]AHZ54573.1 hypothetical protein YBT1520_30329 [Bacillus thuringiensis serovar kurstaki str. YBT-1520]AIE33477.1 hypothetical protein BTK_11990 [Bacillus thuringiensis serovar kurstaki str. HD-1]AIE37626.1 hypothetical protein BTK_30134 [Bacillus thuringiensis serovar kurstaki str. HD-1]AIM35020.1 hypothetical protein DF16_pBMB400orf00
MKKPLKTSTIIVTIITIIACGIGFDFYNHSLSPDTIYSTGIIIIIFLLFSTSITDKSKNTSKPTKKKVPAIFWSNILIMIILFVVISFVTTGHISIQNLILFMCLIIYGGFVIISILSKKGKI